MEYRVIRIGHKEADKGNRFDIEFEEYISAYEAEAFRKRALKLPKWMHSFSRLQFRNEIGSLWRDHPVDQPIK